MKLYPQVQKLFLASLFILVNNAVFSQDKKFELADLNKNAIYGKLGAGAISIYTVKATSLYYERILKQNISNRNIVSIARFGFGNVNFDGDDNSLYTSAEYGLLVGKKTHHLELGAGLQYFFSVKKRYHPNLRLATTIGWRIQKPGGKFIFRMGIGYPDVYIGLGWSF